MPVLPNPLPTVAVLSDPFMVGVQSSFDEEADAMDVRPFRAAFAEHWPTDAHFCCYRLSDHVAVPNGYPRLTKPFLSRARAAGADILTTLIGIDFDNPGHKPWEPGQWDAWLDRLVGIAAEWDAAGQWAVAYSTRHGARLVYVLDGPLPVDKAEPKIRWLISEFTKRGLTADPKCADWTRIFRMPYVVRDGKPTWNDAGASAVQILWQEDNRIAVADIPDLGPVETAQQYGNIETITDPQPDPDDCRKLIETADFKPTEWCKAARRHLRGRESFDVLFNNVPLGKQGERNSRLHKLVGQTIGILLTHEGIEGTTPEHIYALFLGPVQQLEPDAATPDWTAVLWDHIRRLWAKQAAKTPEQTKAEAAPPVQPTPESQGLWSDVILGMRTWCDHPALHDSANNNQAAVDWASQRLIAQVANTYFVMGPNGRYYSEPLLANQVVPHIRRQGLNDLIPTQEIVEGIFRERTLTELLNAHSTIVHDVQITPNREHGGVVRNMDSSNATMMVPQFQLNKDLEPAFNKDVDEWLKQLFGDHYELGTRWIGNALAFDEGPIAAMSIKAEQGVGKKMLTLGLAECLERPCIADHNDLTSAYQYGLLRSPFLVVNEGFPRMHKEQTPYHVFRGLVSGDPLRANRKNMHPVEVRCPYRILFTANNDNIVETLVGTGSLSTEDRAALAIRLIHLDLGDAASRWLRSRGGMVLTGKPGARWVSGDAGQKSDFVVAKHFLWLYHNRSKLRGSRLLVEGNCGADIMFKLRTQGGHAPLVIEALIKMLNSQNMPEQIAVDSNRLYVLPQGVIDFFRLKLAQSTREVLTGTQVMSVLKGLALRIYPHPILLDSKRAMGRRRWIELDAAALLSAAERLGDNCKRLETLVEAQKEFIDKDRLDVSELK